MIPLVLTPQNKGIIYLVKTVKGKDLIFDSGQAFGCFFLFIDIGEEYVSYVKKGITLGRRPQLPAGPIDIRPIVDIFLKMGCRKP